MKNLSFTTTSLSSGKSLRSDFTQKSSLPGDQHFFGFLTPEIQHVSTESRWRIISLMTEEDVVENHQYEHSCSGWQRGKRLVVIRTHRNGRLFILERSLGL